MNESITNETTQLSELVPCDHCGELVPRESLKEVCTGEAVELWCDECVGRDAVECDRCGCLTDDTHMVETADGTQEWCHECTEAHAVECDRCGCLTDDTHMVETADGTQEWCHECTEAHAVMCDRCGDYVDTDAAVDVHGRYIGYGAREELRYCQYCAGNHAIECNDCSELFTEDAISCLEVYGVGEVYLCGDCEDKYVQCERCGCLIYGDDARYTDDYLYCPSCAEEVEDETGGGYISGYHHTYASQFFSTGNEPESCRDLYLGVELEVAGRCSTAKAVCEIAGGRAECKSDSSIDGGFEIASQPATPLYHLTEEDFWPNILKACIDGGMRSHDAGTCGLHIHISRKYFRNESEICTLDRMIQNNANKWVKFSRRTPGQVAQWSRIEDGAELSIRDSDYDYVKREKWMQNKKRFNRYQAVNLTNSETVELRLWRGTLKRRTLFATIEATAGLAILAHESKKPTEFEHMPFGVLMRRIFQALKDNGLPSTDLQAYLLERGL